jgi:alpha-tubulin suppressor-like RCC1 family protein
MGPRRTAIVWAGTAILTASLAASPVAAETVRVASSHISLPRGSDIHHGANGEADVAVCPSTSPRTVSCLARLRLGSANEAVGGARPSVAGAMSTIGDNGAYSPAFLQSAYNLPSRTSGQGQTVAIIDAFDDPNAESDMAVYRNHFGLPPCTSANKCFRKVDEHGGAKLPWADGEWSTEISLDVDMVSAICPRCDILLVEAYQPTIYDLGSAVDTAVRLGATEVSNSYGATENIFTLTGDGYFHHPGVAIVAASGDDGGAGLGAVFPASSPDVVAAGGTTLDQLTSDGTRNATETLWNGVRGQAGSGCSHYEPKPTWQHDPDCSMRMTADVAAVADPETGVWVYDSYPYYGGTMNWTVLGGTSVSSPIIASVYALAGDHPSATSTPSEYPYADPGALNDITGAGSTFSCPDYACAAGPGYDGPTGLGTPNGVRAFQPSAPGAPADLVAGGAAGSVTLAWRAPDNDGGSAITRYDIYRDGAGADPVGSVAAPATTFTEAGLADGARETYRVSAVNAVGEGNSTGVAASVGPIARLAIAGPASAVAGSPTSFAVLASDAAGAALGDETAAGDLVAAPEGACADGACTFKAAGAHTLSATVGALSATLDVTVVPGPLSAVQVTPGSPTISPASRVTFADRLTDAEGNTIADSTATSTFTISPDGRCDGATCAPEHPGAHLVSAYVPYLPAIKSISMHQDHVCVVTAADGVECQGDNSRGQLGIGSDVGPEICGIILTSCSSLFVPVAGLAAGASAVAVGGLFTCALLVNGTVECWGANATGQLGNGTEVDAYSPTPVVGLPAGIVSIAAGYDSACAIDGAGSLWCWGANGSGQLGAGDVAGPSTCRSGDVCATRPVPVTGLGGPVASVSISAQTACVALVAGTAACWGEGNFGQLGNGAMSGHSRCELSITCAAAPSAVRALHDVATVVAGLQTCALTHAGAVWCWGAGASQSLVEGSPGNSSVPKLVRGLSSGVRQVIVANRTACALTAVGADVCWGANNFGQLGIGTFTGPTLCGGLLYCALTPTVVRGLARNVSWIGSSDDAICAERHGNFLCWGQGATTPFDASSGALGEPECTAVPEPSFVESAVVILNVGNRPGPARDVHADERSQKMRVSWRTPANTGGNQVFEYRVDQSADGGRSWRASCRTAALTCVAHRVRGGANYLFRVSATTVIGTGPASLAMRPVRFVSAPGRPREVRVSQLDGAAVLRWRAPINDGGVRISAYVITLEPGHVRVVIRRAGPFGLIGLRPGTLYAVSVRALSPAGLGAAGAAAAFRLLPPAYVTVPVITPKVRCSLYSCDLAGSRVARSRRP